MEVESVFINGTVGAGKSTVASHLSHLLRSSGLPHAVIDLDYVRRSWPAPENDPFNHELELRNLTALAANFSDAGARRFIIAGVIEDPQEIPRYREALGNGRLFICRLTASPAVLRERLHTRHTVDSEGLAWHLRRAGELEAILRGADLDDCLLDTSTAAPAELATRLRDAVGWRGP